MTAGRSTVSCCAMSTVESPSWNSLESAPTSFATGMLSSPPRHLNTARPNAVGSTPATSARKSTISWST